MLDLLWTDVNLTGAPLKVRSGKGRKRRSVRLTSDAIEVIQEWRPLSTGERVFPFRTTAAARLRLQALFRIAGVEYRGLHALRHYCGTWTYRESGDLNVLRKYLGHSSVSTATIYAKMDSRTLDAALARRRSLLRTATARPSRERTLGIVAK